MTRLLVLASPVYSTGGGLRHALAFGRAAADAGWDVDVAIASRRGMAGFPEVVAEVVPSARKHLHSGGAIRSLSWTIRVIVRWCIGSSGVIYAPFSQSMLLGYVLTRGLGGRHRLVIGFQGTPIPEDVASWKRQVYRRALARVMTDPRVTVSAVSRSQLREAFEMLGLSTRTHGSIIGNVAHATGDAPWIVASEPLASARRTAPIDRRIVLLARLSWEKGADVAIRALVDLDDNVILEVAGDGPELDSLTSLASSLGVADRVLFRGWSATAEVLVGASAVVIPSRREGLPAVLLEAMWAQVPVVGSAVGGIADLAPELPGLVLVPPDDPTALASALARVTSSADGPMSVSMPASLRWAGFQQRVVDVLRGSL